MLPGRIQDDSTHSNDDQRQRSRRRDARNSRTYDDEYGDEEFYEEEPAPKRRRGWALWTRRAVQNLDYDDWYGDDDDESLEDDPYEVADDYGSAYEDEYGYPSYDENVGWDLKEIRRERLERRSREAHAGRNAVMPSYEVSRDWLYTSEDAAHTYGGRQRRPHRQLLSGIREIPGAFLSALGSGFGALGTHPRSVFVLIMMLLTGAMLFAPLRDLYVANRKIETLQATYDQLVEENDDIRHQLEMLQTQEGVEDEARSRGYVGPGETKVVVEGLEDEEPGRAHALDVIPEDDIPDTRPWYVILLDRLFDYDPEA